MSRRTAKALFLCVILLAGVAFLLPYRDRVSDMSDRFSLYVTYRAGGDFYRDHSEKIFRTDERWFSALLFGYRNAIISGDVESATHDPSLRVLSVRKRALSVFESPDPIRTGSEYDYRIRGEYRRFLVDPWDAMLLRTLYCRVYGYSDADFSALASIPLDGKYADTHKLLGLLLLREQRCYDRNILDRMIRQGAGHIARSADADPQWSDLFSERVVFLYWAGEGSLVKREWIDRIADAQGGDGGWVDPRRGAGPNAHSTGLSMLAIRYFLEGKAGTDFFAPLDRAR